MSYLISILPFLLSFFFFFNDTATTEIYTLSLHDALPISPSPLPEKSSACSDTSPASGRVSCGKDRKSTRLNSSHQIISYAVFCLKKKKLKKNMRMCIDKGDIVSIHTCSCQRFDPMHTVAI